MKTKLLLTALTLFVFITASQAQSQGDIRATAGFALGTSAAYDSDTGEDKIGLGINFGAEYLIIDALSIAPSYTIWFNGVDGLTTSSLNIDGRYYFLTDATQVYGLLGFASARASGGGITVSESGMNIGIGAIFPLSDNFGVNVQGKYTTPGDGQAAFNAGLVYTF